MRSLSGEYGAGQCSRGEEMVRAGCDRVCLGVPGGVRPRNQTQSSGKGGGVVGDSARAETSVGA